MNISMKKLLFVISAMLPVVFSCSSSQKQNGIASVGAKSIDIEINNSSTLRFSEVFDQIDYTPLETTDSFLVATVEKMRIFGDKICLVCDKSLLIFDKKTGKGNLNIARVGSAPGEYESLYDVSIDQKSNEIELLDMNGKSIHIYDMKGKYKKSLSLPFMSFSFAKADKYDYWFYNNQLLSDKTNSKLVYFNVPEDKIVDESFPIDNHLASYFFVVEGTNFVKRKDEVLFFSCPSDTIYSLASNSEPNAAYILNFGTHAAPADFYKHKYADVMEFSQEANKRQYVYFVNNFTANEDCVLLSFLLDRKCFWSLYLEKNKKTYTTTSLEDDINFLSSFSLDYCNVPFAMDGDNFYFLMSAEQFLSLREAKEAGKGFAEASLGDFKIDEQSNPILVRCRLKKNI